MIKGWTWTLRLQGRLRLSFSRSVVHVFESVSDKIAGNSQCFGVWGAMFDGILKVVMGQEG
jgi:hypothetical protein